MQKDVSFDQGSFGMASTTDEKRQLAGDPNRGKSDFGLYLYNKKTGEVCGRTLGSWFWVLGYLVAFSACTAALWGLCLWVFYQTLDNYTPKLQTYNSFIGQNPGLGFR